MVYENVAFIISDKSDWCSTLHKKKKKKRTHFQRVRLLVSKNKQLKHKFSRCNIRRAKIRVLMKALTSQKIPDLTSLTRNCEKLSLLQKNFNSYASLHSERIENTNVDVEIDPTKKVESGPLRESVIPVLREVQSDLTKSVQQTALYYHAHCNNIKNLASPIHSHWQSEISYVPSTSPCSQVLLSETTCWNDVETSVCDDVLQIELDSEDETLSDTIVAVPQDSKSFFDDSVNKNKDNVPQTPRRHTGGSQCHKSLFVNFYEHDDDFSAYKVLQLSPW